MSQKQSTINGNSVQYQYQYDNAGRLTREQMGDSITSYTYDSYNNRSGMNTNGVQYSYSYDANNRLTNRTKSEDGQQEHTNYTYDNNGNMLSWIRGTYTSAEGIPSISLETDGTEYGLYSYDAYNRLKTYTNGVTNASYTYDGNNLRQSKTVDGVTTNHIWDGSNMVMEIKGTTVNKYYRGATGLIYSDIDGERRYYHKDEHGNVAAMTNAAGNVINVNTYDAFGNMTQTNESITDPFGYCGEYYDTELDALYLRNRYYSPSIGRFITEDPIKDGLNWYAYCGNNPIMFIDPWGLGKTAKELMVLQENIMDLIYEQAAYKYTKQQYEENKISLTEAEDMFEASHERAEQIRGNITKFMKENFSDDPLYDIVMETIEKGGEATMEEHGAILFAIVQYRAKLDDISNMKTNQIVVNYEELKRRKNYAINSGRLYYVGYELLNRNKAYKTNILLDNYFYPERKNVSVLGYSGYTKQAVRAYEPNESEEYQYAPESL